MLGRLAATALFCVLATAVLFSLAPGSDFDEREGDASLSGVRRLKIRAEREEQNRLTVFIPRYLASLARGDLGVSQASGRPVAELLADRWPVTARAAFGGLVLGCGSAMAVSLLLALFRGGMLDLAASLSAGLLLCLPTAGLALMLMPYRGLGEFARILVVAAAVFPRMFRVASNLIEEAGRRAHVLAARARGVGRFRIAAVHMLGLVRFELAAMWGVCGGIALSACLPAEVALEAPGLGHMAFQAAIGRDLPVLINISMLVTLVTVGSNMISDEAARRSIDRQAEAAL